QSVLDLARPRGEVTFDRAPARRLDRLGGTDVFDRIRDRIAAGLIAEAAGAAGKALELATDHAKVRVQFDQPIGAFQAVQHLLADMLRAVHLARSGARTALRAADAGDHDGCHRATIAAAAHAVEALPRVGADAIQVFGGIGFTWEHDAHLYWRRTMSLAHEIADVTEQREAWAGLLLDR
ncbi:MAG TPA: acyl-CoA dehydrogenase family protein, partial [Nitriliruptorales bacterium]